MVVPQIVILGRVEDHVMKGEDLGYHLTLLGHVAISENLAYHVGHGIEFFLKILAVNVVIPDRPLTVPCRRGSTRLIRRRRREFRAR